MKISNKRVPRNLFKLSPLTAAVVAAIYPAAGQAADEPKVLEEVIVTATKRATDLQDVGQSITAFSTFDIERMGIKSMKDYIAALPSVVLKSERPGRNDLVMRGVSEDANTWYVDSQVSLYLDETPMTTSSQQVSVRAIDLQRIEALPGPQGTLFGASSQTGTLRMITNKPDHDGFSGAIDASYGAIKGGDVSHDISGHLNIPLIENVLSMRIVGYTSHDGGYVDNVYGESWSGSINNSDIVAKDQNEYDVDGGRVALLWNMSDDWSLLGTYIAQNSALRGTWETDPSLGEDHKVIRFNEEFRDDEWWSASFTLSGDVGFATLTANATHFDREITYEWDNQSYADWRMSYYGVYLGYANYATEYNRSQEFNEQPQERDTFELRLASSGDGKLQWMAGVYWEDIWDYWYYGAKHDNFKDTAAFAYATYAACYYDGAYGIDCPLPDNEVGYVNILDRSVEQTAIFAEISYDLTEKLTVTAGTRYAEITRDIYNLTHLPEGLPPAGLRDTYGIDTSKATEDETLYKLSANYAINDDVMVYGLFSQGFRVGGANSQRAHLYDPDTLPLEYDSDFMDNYELGIKSTWLDGRLMVNAQLFLMEWTDYQVTNYGGGDLPWWVYGNVNAETAESKGFELNLNWQVTDKLQLKSSFYAGKAQFTEDVVIGDDEYWDGMAMPNSPDRKAYLSLNYDIPGVFGGDMWLWYDISYVSDTWNRTYAIRANDKDGIAPAHHISNFQVGLDLSDGLSLTLRVENVWDQTEYTWASTSGKSRQAWFDTTQGYNERSLTQPRTVSFAVSKKF